MQDGPIRFGGDADITKIAKKQLKLRASIRSKFILGYVIIGLLPILIFGILIAQTVEKDIQESIFHHLDSIADSRAQWINTYYEERSGDVYILSTSPTVQSIFSQYMTNTNSISALNTTSYEYLLTHKNTYEYEDILFINLQGHLWWSMSNKSQQNITLTDELYNTTNLALLYQFFISSSYFNDVLISDFELNELAEKPAAYLAAPVVLSNETQPIGMAAIQINNDQINAIVQNPTGLGETGETYLVGRDLYMRSDSAFSSNSTMLQVEVNSENVEKCFLYAFHPEKNPGYEEIYLYENYRNARVVGTHAFIPDAQVALIAEIEISEAYAPINATKFNLLLMTGFFIILILVVSYGYSRSLLKPIKKLMQGTKIIGGGNLDHSIDIQTRDEIQELSDSFNHMAKNLKQSQDKIRQYTLELEEKVAERTQELETKVKEIKRYSEQLEQVNKDVYHSNKELEITQRHLKELNERLEEKVQERTIKIEQLLKQKDDFIGHLGHDLKTPISVLINLIPIIQNKINDSHFNHDFTIILRNIDYISKLVHETLEIAKLSSTQVSLTFEAIPLASFILEVTTNLQTILKNNNIDIEHHVDESITVYADALHLQRVFENLFSNAIKAMPAGGNITISTEKPRETNMIIISVTDTGIGIPPHQLDTIFQEFYKIDESRHHLDSTGLGLSICKRIITQHGGRIWAESPGEGKGAIFKFTLPIRNPKEGWKTHDHTSNDRR